MSSGESKAMSKPASETRQMGTCAGVGICETGAPAESAATSGDGCTGCDYVINEIHGQELHGASGANDGVLFHRETEKTVHPATGRRFHWVGTTNGTRDADTENDVGDGAGKCKIGAETPVACGNWHQPARAVNERCH